MGNIMRKAIIHEYHVSNSWLQTKNTFARLECGHAALVCAGEHDASKMLPEYPCEQCGDIEAKRAELIEIKSKYNIVHTRARPFMGNYYISVYAQDNKSPSGVIRVAGYPNIPELADIFTGSLSPLSPTEGLSRR